MRWFSHCFEENELHFAESENGCVLFAGSGSVKKEVVKKSEEDYPIVEILLSGCDHKEHHFSKHLGSRKSLNLRFKETCCRKEGSQEIFEIIQCNSQIEVCSRFRFFSGVKGWSNEQIIRNISDETIVLDYVSAFFTADPLEMKENWENCAYIWLAHNYWKAECGWRRYPVTELGLSACSVFSGKRISICNTGTWSTKEYLPSGILENARNGKMLYWDIEGSLSWNWELSTVNGKLYLAAGGPSLQETGWQKVLAPEEEYVTPNVFITKGLGIEEIFGQATDYRRAMRRYDVEKFGQLCVFNDYMNCLDTDPTTEKELPLIECAARLGCRYYMIDAGWYTDGFWWDDTGEWRAAPTRFTGGLEFVLNKIRSFGMIPGLWVEIEVMSAEQEYTKRLPDDWFFLRNGERVIDNSRCVLNFANPAVRKYADEVMERLIDEYGAGYIKMDHNVNGGAGTEPGNYGAGVEQHWRWFLLWLDDVRKRYPHVIFESCASGGLRMEYGLLSRFHLQSTSDQTDCFRYAPIAANCVTAVLPEQAGVWSYPCVGQECEQVAFNMVNGILLRVYQSGRVDLLDEKNFTLVQEGIAVNKALDDLIGNGHPFWPIGLAQQDSAVCAFGLYGNRKRVLCVWNLGNKNFSDIPLYKYSVKDVKVLYPKELPTDYSFTDGVLTIRPHCKYFARLFVLEE